MPRTKVPKSGKRNRDADVTQREEKIRELDKELEAYFETLERTSKAAVDEIRLECQVLMESLTPALLNANFCSVLNMNLKNMKDYIHTPLVSVPSNDDGYITEESNNGERASSCSLLTIHSSVLQTSKQQQQTARGRTPGPLTSRRRSRSACYEQQHQSVKITSSNISTISSSNSNVVKKTPSVGGGRAGRSKMRTPVVNRTKAFSADRSTAINPFKSPPTAFLRWPKPGELVVSVHGTPVLAQVAPGITANVNIPMKDGVLSLQPKKLSDLHPDLLENMDPETIGQIATLKDSLNKILSLVEKNQ